MPFNSKENWWDDKCLIGRNGHSVFSGAEVSGLYSKAVSIVGPIYKEAIVESRSQHETNPRP